MPTPGRNDPCPCGSGKKYKKCCGEATTEVPITPADRDQAFELLTAYFSGRRFDDDRAGALVLFWGEDLLEEGLDLDEDERWLEGLCLEWCLFDYITERGATVAERALADERASLWPGARRFVESCIASPIRLVQVETVDRGRGLVVRDLLERGRHYTIRDRLGSEQMVRHDVVVARLVPDGDEWQIEGTPARLQVTEKQPLVRRIKRRQKQLHAEVPDVPAPVERMFVSRELLVFVVDRVLYTPLPALHTTDGDVLDPTTVVFDVVDHPGVRQRLALDPAFQPEDEPSGASTVNLYTWLDAKADAPSEALVLAHLTLTSAQLRAEALSLPRAARVQARLHDLLGDTAKLAGLVNAGLEPPEGRSLAPDADLPIELRREIERDFYERHYGRWIDEPVPMLDGRTPREAAAVPKLRAKLLTLVEGIENQAARLALEGSGFDTEWLREALGLRRRNALPRRRS